METTQNEFRRPQKTVFLIIKYKSTLVISKLKGPSETLRDIRISTYQFSELRKIQIAQPNFTNEYVIRLL